MEESVAKRKWCPMIREVSDMTGDIYTNRVSTKHGYNCITSNCMMWIMTEARPVPSGYCGFGGE